MTEVAIIIGTLSILLVVAFSFVLFIIAAVPDFIPFLINYRHPKSLNQKKE